MIKKFFRVLCSFFLSLQFSGIINTIPVHAENKYEGVVGTCPFIIDENNNLIIGQEGTSCELPDYDENFYYGVGKYNPLIGYVFANLEENHKYEIVYEETVQVSDIQTLSFLGNVKVLYARGLLGGLSGVKIIDLKNLDFAGANDFGYLFWADVELIQIRNFDILIDATRECDEVNYLSMFFDCKKLPILNLSGMNFAVLNDTRQVSNLFGNCTSLTTIYVDKGLNIDKIIFPEGHQYDKVLTPFSNNNSLYGGDGFHKEDKYFEADCTYAHADVDRDYNPPFFTEVETKPYVEVEWSIPESVVIPDNIDMSDSVHCSTSLEAYRPVSYSGSETKETINIDTPKQEVANQTTTESSSNIFVPIGVFLFVGVIVLVLLKFKNKKL